MKKNKVLLLISIMVIGAIQVNRIAVQEKIINLAAFSFLSSKKSGQE